MMPAPLLAPPLVVPRPRRESDYALIVRCQLVCTNTKTDTVMATHPDTGEMVFLKGPFPTRRPVEMFVHLQNLKRDAGLPYVKSRLLSCS